MVDLFMRRASMMANASIEYPPVRDALRYYWDGYDLSKLTTETGWPDKVSGNVYDFYRSVTGETLDAEYYDTSHHALRKKKGANTGDGFDNRYWPIGGTSGSTENYTVEFVVYLDYTAAISTNIVGGTKSTSELSLCATELDGLYIAHNSSAVDLGTGILGIGFHVYTLVREYDASASSKRYQFSAYCDGQEIGTTSAVSWTLASCNDATLGYALGCIAQHGRALSAAEVAKNARYYRTRWKGSPVIGIFTDDSTFVVEKSGDYRLQLVGAGGHGGAGSRYTQALIDQAAANDKEYYYLYYGGLSGGGGGGGGGYCESVLSLSAGDKIQAVFDGTATRVILNGAEIMTANNGADGQSGKTISTVGSVRDGWYETAVYSGGAGGSAEGGNVSNITGNHGGNGKGAEEPTSSGGAASTSGAGAAGLPEVHGYPSFGVGGKGGRGHFVYGSYDNAQFYGDNFGEAGSPGVCIISKV